MIDNTYHPIDPMSFHRPVHSLSLYFGVFAIFAGGSPLLGEPATSKAIPRKSFTNKLGMTFVELPRQKIGIAIHEVTRKQFGLYAEASGLKARSRKLGDHPVVNVSWEEALQFCDWLSEQDDRTYRLPTDYEWSIAAGMAPEIGYQSPQERSEDAPEEFFWEGNWNARGIDARENYADRSHQSVTGKANCFPFDDGYSDTAPVGSFQPNPIGIHDMGGNVSEWVYDWYQSRDQFKTLRGASYQSGADAKNQHYKGYRSMKEPGFRSESLGFRVVLEIPEGMPESEFKEDPDSRKEIEITYSGKDGVNLRHSRSFSSSTRVGALFRQKILPLEQIGSEVKDDEEIWVNIEVKGWIPTKSGSYTFLKDQGDGTWKVVWNKKNDRYVAMRTGPSSNHTLISKVFYNTVVEELASKPSGRQHYIYAKFSGWSVKTNKARSYLRNLE